MWALFAFAFVASAMASPADPSLENKQDIQSAGNSIMSHNISTTMEDRLNQSCLRYADSEAFERIINERNNFLSELQTTAVQEAFTAVMEGEKANYINIFCKLSPTIKSGIGKIVTAIKPCIKPQKREELNLTFNVTESFLDYVCYNEGERVFNFIRDGGAECITEKQNMLNQCLETAMGEGEKENEVDSDILSSNESLDKEENEKILAEECREMTKFETCVKTSLDQCPNPSSSSFVVGVFDSIFNPVCEKYKEN